MPRIARVFVPDCLHHVTQRGVDYLLSVVRYVVENPVRAGLVAQPWDYQWFSTRWAMGLVEKDPLVHSLGLLTEIDNWKAFLSSEPGEIAQLVGRWEVSSS